MSYDAMICKNCAYWDGEKCTVFFGCVDPNGFCPEFKSPVQTYVSDGTYADTNNETTVESVNRSNT